MDAFVQNQINQLQEYCQKTAPKVIVWTLVYNHEPYLRDYFEGIIKQQTNFNFIAAVHDDLSTDNSAEIIKEYAEKYPDIIKPIYEKENQYSKHDGSLENLLNMTLKASGAEYLAVCEGDDYWTDPLKLKKQVDFMESNPEYTLCYTELNFYEQSTKQTIKNVFASHYINRYQTYQDFLIYKGYIAPCSWLLKKGYFKAETGNPIDTTYDVALYNYCNGKVGYLPDNTCTYRILEQSASHLSSMKAIYNRSRGLYKTQLHYINHYAELLSPNIVYQIKANALKGLLLSAWYFNDTDIKTEIQSFYSNSIKFRIIMAVFDIPFFKSLIPLYRAVRVKIMPRGLAAHMAKAKQ